MEFDNSSKQKSKEKMIKPEQPDFSAILSGFERLSHTSVLIASHYEVSCSITPSDGTIRASAKVRAEATQDDISSMPVLLDQSFAVEKITLGGRACSYTRRDGLLWLELPACLTEGQEVEISFEYAGPMPAGLIRSPADGPYIELQMQCGWLPLIHIPLTKWYTFQLKCEVPIDLRMIASGEEIAVKTKNGRATYLQRSFCPVPDLVIIAGRYQYATREEGEVRLEALVLPSAPYQPESVIDEAARLLTFYQNQFGPYPFGLLGVVCPPDSLSGNYASPGLLIAGQMRKAPPDEMRGFSILAHELSHMWWGFQVQHDPWTDLWLMEALAVYSTLLAIEERFGRNGLRKYVRERVVPRLKQAETSGVPLAKCSWTTPNSDQLREDKGSAVLLQLRTMMGEGCFDEMLREFVSTNTGKLVTTADFTALASSKAGIDLEDFFTRYLYGTEKVKL